MPLIQIQLVLYIPTASHYHLYLDVIVIYHLSGACNGTFYQSVAQYHFHLVDLTFLTHRKTCKLLLHLEYHM